MVQMWKQSSIVEEVENVRYAEEHMNLTGGARAAFLHRSRFIGNTPRTFPREGGSRPPPYGNKFVPRTIVVGISMATSAASHSSPTVQTSPRSSQGIASRGRGSRGRNSFRN
jgi:hypothetical protein